MYYFYLLWSKKLQKYYYGYTSDLRRRVKEHGSRKGGFTKSGRPWKLVYYEAYLAKEDAKKREKTVKYKGNVLYFIKKRLEESLNVA